MRSSVAPRLEVFSDPPFTAVTPPYFPLTHATTNPTPQITPACTSPAPEAQTTPFPCGNTASNGRSTISSSGMYPMSPRPSTQLTPRGSGGARRRMCSYLVNCRKSSGGGFYARDSVSGG